VLAARYGEEAGRVMVGGRRGSPCCEFGMV
jgi:hypothetical protein